MSFSVSAATFRSSVAIGLALHRVGVKSVAFEQLAFLPRSALPSELTRANGDHLLFAVAIVDAEEHRHPEDTVRASAFSLELHRVDSEDVDFFVLLIETTLLQLVERMNVELVFSFNVLYVFFDFGEVRGESGPALGCVYRPDVDFAGLDAGCGDVWTGGVPLYPS
jgi:hypothetical protein